MHMAGNKELGEQHWIDFSMFAIPQILSTAGDEAQPSTESANATTRALGLSDGLQSSAPSRPNQVSTTDTQTTAVKVSH